MKAGRTIARSVAVLTTAACLWSAASAQAEITSVFTDTATPVDCTVLTGQDEGIRFCTQGPGEQRSTVASPVDGVPLDVNVAFPPADEYAPYEPNGGYPVVMLFHGYAGQKLGLGDMRPWLNRGYATFSVTTRGNHQSCGTPAARAAGGSACDDGYVRLMDTRYEVRDTQELIALLVDEGLIDPDAIGATGGSYGGGMSMALAALNDRKMLQDGSLVDWVSPDGTPLHIAAATPSIPWTDLAYSLVPNGGLLDYIADSPYIGHVDSIGVEKQTYVAGLYGAGMVNGFYAPEGSDPSADLTGWKNELDTGGPYGQEAFDIVDEITTYHSSYYIDDSIAPSPVLISSGATDDLFPANEALRYFNRTLTEYPEADIGVTIGAFGHPRGGSAPAFVNNRAVAWMDYYVKGEGAKPEGGIDYLTQACSGSPAGPYHGDTVADVAPGEIVYESVPGQTIAANPAGVLNGPTFNFGSACANGVAGDSTSAAVYKLDAAPAGGFTLVGSPTVIARIDSPGANNQIAGRLLDVAPDGTQKLIARTLLRPEVGDERQVFQLNPNAWKFEAGHVAKLELTPHDNPHGRISPGQTAIDVSRLELRLPVLESPGALGGLVARPLPKVLPEGTELAPGFDSKPPKTKAKAKVKRKKTVVRFSSNEANSTFECKRGKNWRACESPLVIKKGRKARPKLKIRAIDAQGNVDPTPAKVRLDRKR